MSTRSSELIENPITILQHIIAETSTRTEQRLQAERDANANRLEQRHEHALIVLAELVTQEPETLDRRDATDLYLRACGRERHAAILGGRAPERGDATLLVVRRVDVLHGKSNRT
jgi:hypothetical protein